MICTSVKLVVPTLLLALVCSDAHAIEVFTNETSFLNAVAIESTEDFQSFLDGQTLGFGETTVDELTYSILGIPRNWFVEESPGSNGLSNRLTTTFPQPSEITFGDGLTQSIGFLVSAFPSIAPAQVVVTSSTGNQVSETFSGEAYFGFSTPEGIASVSVESIGGSGNWAVIAFDNVSRADIKLIPEPGDMNADGLFNGNDVKPFVLALTNRAEYEALYPWIDADVTGDVNDSGEFDLGDIGAFKLLVGTVSGQLNSSPQSYSVPEPSSIILCMLGMVMTILRGGSRGYR